MILDTDILIDIQRGYNPALDWFSHLTELPMLPGFVVMELIRDTTYLFVGERSQT